MHKIFGSVLVLALSAGPSWADAFCSRHAANAQPNTLYVVGCNGGCIQTVVSGTGGYSLVQDSAGSTTKLPAGTVRFLYKTREVTYPNSLVVIQQKIKAAKQQDQVQPVNLVRYPFNFRCSTFSRNARADAWPLAGADPDMGVDAIEGQFVHRSYDQFHRTGQGVGDDDKRLRSFHTPYFNGDSCVSTLVPERRAQFLLHDRTTLIGKVNTFFSSLGLGTSEAFGEPQSLRAFQRLRVVVQNYSTKAGQTACFTFTATSGGTELALSLSEVERNVGLGSLLDSGFQNWTFDTSR